MKQLETITISGQISGNIWMPCIECNKDFSVKFSPNNRPFTREWTDLRDAFLHITNDGDFRGCAVDYAFIDVTWIEGNKRISFTKEIKPGKFISDLFN